MSRARRCHIIPEIEGNSRRGNAIEPGKELTLILESETERVTQMVGELLEITFSDAVINIYSATCTLLALSLSLSLSLSLFFRKSENRLRSDQAQNYSRYVAADESNFP